MSFKSYTEPFKAKKTTFKDAGGYYVKYGLQNLNNTIILDYHIDQYKLFL